jgi:hypothetical protein
MRRFIGAYEGTRPGPTMVVVGGMHGNEPAGIAAVQQVLQELRSKSLPLRGRMLGLAGNLRALEQNVRYLDRDLNRLWYPDHLAGLRAGPRGQYSPEDIEQLELLEIFERLDATFDHPLVVIDLHSFSAEGPPFSVFADALRNRPIAFEMRVPIIFGLEESVDGTLLGYLVDHGHIAVGFEAGQHDDPRTLDNHVAAIWMSLVAAGLLARHEVPEIERWEEQLDRAAAGLPQAVEIVYRHAITPEHEFQMDPGWSNFVELRRGQRLAVDRGGAVGSPMDGRILMPLYQALGEDGFFVARDVSFERMQLSAALREHAIDKLLPWLPIIDIDHARGHVRLREPIDRAGAVDVLRLLGYRRERRAEGELHMTRRRQHGSQRRGRGTPWFIDED